MACSTIKLYPKMPMANVPTTLARMKRGGSRAAKTTGYDGEPHLSHRSVDIGSRDVKEPPPQHDDAPLPFVRKEGLGHDSSMPFPAELGLQAPLLSIPSAIAILI